MTPSARPKILPKTRPLGLILTIDRTAYSVGPIACDPVVADRAFRLRKSDGTLYDVVQTRFGPECDCPDFVFRRDGLDPAGCKHVRALLAYGMIRDDGDQTPPRRPIR